MLGGYITPNPIFETVYRALDTKLMQLQPSYVYTGMALGVDQWAARLCINNDIPFIAVLPFENYGGRWPDSARARFEELLRHARRIIVLSTDTSGNHVERLIRDRNRYLVREADAVLAVYNGDPATGTGQTLSLASHFRKPVYLADIPATTLAAARRFYEIEESRKRIAQDSERSRVVADFSRREFNRRPELTRTARAQMNDFLDTAFKENIQRANTKKAAEKVEEDLAAAKPRRVIEV